MNSIKVLLAKLGFDGHDRGVKVVATGLRDAGMEVVYIGPWQTPESVAKAAIEEDVDVIGISSLGYDHVLIPKLLTELKKVKSDIPVIVGGIIPPDEVHALKDAGVAEVFPPGSSMDSIVHFVRKIVSHSPQRDCKG
jgi:methylmalonyl-CoA mutase C-terminal domain/subunit